MQGQSVEFKVIFPKLWFSQKPTFPTEISSLVENLSRDFHLDWAFASRGLVVREESLFSAPNGENYIICVNVSPLVAKEKNNFGVT